MNRHIAPEVFPAATDLRFLSAVGFSPMRLILLHEDFERIELGAFLDGKGVCMVLV